MKQYTDHNYEYVATLLRYACRQFTEDELQDMPELYRWFRKHDAEHHVVQEKQPQPGWVINEFRDIGWRTIGPGGYVIVLNEDYEEFRGAYDLTWEDLPNCTGWDYKIPPEETPAERRLREVGLKEHNGDYLKPTGKAGVTYSISWRHWTVKQVEAIAAHMREQIGGAE